MAQTMKDDISKPKHVLQTEKYFFSILECHTLLAN